MNYQSPRQTRDWHTHTDRSQLVIHNPAMWWKSGQVSLVVEGWIWTHTEAGNNMTQSTPGRLMKTTAVVFIRDGDRQKYRDFPHWFMWEIAIFKSSEFAYTQFMTPKVRYQSDGRVRWILIEKLVIEISRWWRPLEMGMKTTDCVAGDLMKTTVVN